MIEDPQDIFDQMDAMMARMFAEMSRGTVTGMPPHATGYRIIIQGGGMPRGPPDGSGIEMRNPGEPVPEVHQIGDEVKVIVELPGVTDESLRLDVQGDRLIIDAGDADRHYHTSAPLPPVNAAPYRKSLKNGVLEVTFRVPEGTPEKEGSLKK
jgi:HSP20 family protein